MANHQAGKQDTLEIEKVPELRDELPFDPDQGLSDEEKKQIVSIGLEHRMALDTANHLEDDRLVRRLDLRLLPWLSLPTLAGFLDRTNMGNAKIEGLWEMLNLTNCQYNASSTIVFIPYICTLRPIHECAPKAHVTKALYSQHHVDMG
jgi:hypothetical protein